MLNSATPELQIDWKTVVKKPTPDGQQRVQAFAQAVGVDAEALFQPLRVEAGDQRLQAGQIFRQLAEEIRQAATPGPASG